jgi:hypothetical protein
MLFAADIDVLSSTLGDAEPSVTDLAVLNIRAAPRQP